MKRTYTVERLYSLGNYKNIKYMASVEVDESDTRPAIEIFAGLTDDVYETFFQHAHRLERLNTGKNLAEQEQAFFEGE